jgi:EAL domain-containing protein (putative c-di-GMP-specific phosphodiesterase class I)
MSVLDRIRRLIMETPFSWEKNDIYPTVSIGCAQINAQSDNMDSVMRKAYLACESAKDHGRNRIIEYALHDKDQMRQDEMMVWVKRIETSLDDFLVLRCQEIRPINNVAHKSHYEVLLGVYDKQGNMLPPINLIEAAEHYGRMPRIDRWVVHNALAWMEKNPKIVATIDGLSINLSGASIGDESFLEFVLAELAACSIVKEKICFEVTETAAITSLSEATEFISILKKKGCKFALDDFGTGLSSYAYIQSLPVDYLKIDGVFIRNITNNQKDEALVRSINDLAHFMGMKTTAEYVENQEIFALLADIGVDKAQGYGVHKPMLLNELGIRA